MMKQCSICGRNPAALKVRQLDSDGKATEIDVCEECGRQRGLCSVHGQKLPPAEVLAELGRTIVDVDNRIKCPGCGMSCGDFKRRGRLGCARCYTAFHDQLVPLIRRIQGAVQHIGKTTNSGRKQAHDRMHVERLRDALATAVKDEDYERAASLRDQLRQAGDDPSS